jgi:hypothetical protein
LLLLLFSSFFINMPTCRVTNSTIIQFNLIQFVYVLFQQPQASYRSSTHYIHYTLVTGSKSIRRVRLHIQGFSGKTCAIRCYVDITKNKIGDTIHNNNNNNNNNIMVIKYNSGSTRPNN